MFMFQRRLLIIGLFKTQAAADILQVGSSSNLRKRVMVFEN